MKSRIQRALGLALLLLATSTQIGAEQRRVESVGVVGMRDGLSQAPREAALEGAVKAAVLQVARGLLPSDFRPPDTARPKDASAWLEDQIGDPRRYASRYSILDDRGERRAIFVDDPEVESEYVVLAAVTVDVDGLADRLNSLGLLRSQGPRTQVRLVIEGLESYRPVSVLRDALEADRRVRSVLPVEFSRGRAVLAVSSDRSAEQIVRDLQREAPGGLQVIPLDLGLEEASLLVDGRP